ncbi:MAG: hypothetical protein V7756_08465 [Halopseudomonas sp.]
MANVNLAIAVCQNRQEEKGGDMSDYIEELIELQAQQREDEVVEDAEEM